MKVSQNTIQLIKEVIDILKFQNFEVALFGGWAEELCGIIQPREHGDIDLLLFAENFDDIDKWIRSTSQTEITAKRLPHKRAILINSVMVEMLLVCKTQDGYITDFFEKYIYFWPDFKNLVLIKEVPVVSKDILESYRINYEPIGKLSKEYFSEVMI